MGRELLQDTTFEGRFDPQLKGKRAYAVYRGGQVERVQAMNIHPLEHWDFWYVVAPGLVAPEMRDAWRAHDAKRVRSGDKSLVCHVPDRYHAGWMQTVVVPEYGPVTFFAETYTVWPFRNNDTYIDDASLVYEDGRLVASAWMHAWSNHAVPGFEHVGDGSCSVGVGCGPVAIRETEVEAWIAENIPESTDEMQDAVENVTLAVGIDLSGGRNPLAEGVVWGERWHVYNGYCQQLRCEVVIEAEEGCRGRPREPYARTYNVVPAWVPDEEAVEIFRRCFVEGRETVGGSFDDAGVGDLDQRLARLWEISPAEYAVFVNWYETYYPGVEVEFAALEEEAPGPGEPEEPEEIWDRDIRDEMVRNGEWKQRTLGQIRGFCVHHTTSHSPHNTARHCVHNKQLPSIQYHFWGPEAGGILYTESLESAMYHNHNGYPNYDISYGMAGDLTKHPPTEQAMDDAVRAAAWAVKNPDMDVTLERVTGHRDFHNTDCPGWQTGWKAEFYRRLRQRLGVEEPVPAPPVDPPDVEGPPGPTVSFHAQAGAQGDMEYVARVKPSVWKLCHQAGMARGIHEASPETLIVYRKVYNDWHDYIYGYSNLGQAAYDFIEWMLPEISEIGRALKGARFAVEGLNETIATGATEDIRRVVEFERQFAYRVAELPYNCVPVVLNTAVGNPQHGDETEMLIPAVRAAVETEGFVGYHSYWPSNPTQTWLQEDWEHFAGRWAESWDPTFRAAGLRPRYILTESGPIGNSNVHLDALNGWRHPRCNDGNWEKTLGEIMFFELMAWASVPGQEGRYWGQCLFTTGNVGWEYFQFRRAQFEAIAELL